MVHWMPAPLGDKSAEPATAGPFCMMNSGGQGWSACFDPLTQTLWGSLLHNMPTCSEMERAKGHHS